jgi:hypothetical protein
VQSRLSATTSSRPISYHRSETLPPHEKYKINFRFFHHSPRKTFNVSFITMASRVVKLIPNKTALFVCDIQEAFHPVMHAYPSVISTCKKMIQAAPLLSLPIIITEQNPSRLGKTVPLPREALEEMEKREQVLIVEKTKFSMMVEGVEEKLKEWGIESVIIFGIEVEFFPSLLTLSPSSFSFPLPPPLQKKKRYINPARA